MDPVTSHTCQKWSTVLGGFLMLFYLSLPWYWGNVSVYALSYFRSRHSSSRELDTPLVIPLFLLATCLGSFVAGFGTRLLGKRPTLVSGILLFSGGWLAAYPALDVSLQATSLVLGLAVSLGAFVIQGTALLYCLEWADRDTGLVTSLVLSGFTTGPIVINEFTSLYVNPRNLPPDSQDGPSVFFSQQEILDRVPSLFLLLALGAVLLNSVGLVLIRQNPRADSDKSRDLEEVTCPVAQSSTATTPRHTYTDKGVDDTPARSDQHGNPSHFSLPTGHTDQSADVHPFTVLRGLTLYVLWCLCLCGETSFILVTNYYKSYGQLYIHDDHFLTTLSTVLLVVMSLSRIFWGWLLDRAGVKVSFVCSFSCSAGVCLILFFSPLSRSKGLYSAAVLLFGFAATHKFLLLSSCAANLYGKKHYLFNLGLIMAPTILINPALPYILQLVLASYGWFGVTLLPAVASVLGLVATVTMLQEC